jgi:hypothetical protein
VEYLLLFILMFMDRFCGVLADNYFHFYGHSGFLEYLLFVIQVLWRYFILMFMDRFCGGGDVVEV